MTVPVLQVSDMTIRFGGLVAVDRVSLAVERNRVHGLIGPNGAGKTTLFNAVTGLVPQSSGTVCLNGRDITGLPAHLRARAGIRRSFQSVHLVESLTVLENVLIGLHCELAGRGWRGVLDLFGRRPPDAAAQRRVRDVLEFLDLGDTLMKPVAELTFAQQRFVEIARAIVARPTLLMLDEPAAGLSEAEIEKLDALLRRLCREWDMTILLVEHVLSLVMVVSDEITVLENGRLIAHGDADAVARDPRVKAAYLGEDVGAAG